MLCFLTLQGQLALLCLSSCLGVFSLDPSMWLDVSVIPPFTSMPFCGYLIFSVPSDSWDIGAVGGFHCDQMANNLNPSLPVHSFFSWINVYVQGHDKDAYVMYLACSLCNSLRFNLHYD